MTKRATKKPPKDAAQARRIPTQARAKERATRILDAAATELARIGLDAATMEGIAARAGTSVGSIYQFYANKQAVFDALVMRYLDASRDLFERLVREQAAEPSWEKMLDRAVDAFAALDREGPLFRVIWANWHHASAMAEVAFALNRQFAQQVELLLARLAPSLPARERPVVATIVVETMAAGLLTAARTADEKLADALVAETKVLLRRYLRPIVRARA